MLRWVLGDDDFLPKLCAIISTTGNTILEQLESLKFHLEQQGQRPDGVF